MTGHGRVWLRRGKAGKTQGARRVARGGRSGRAGSCGSAEQDGGAAGRHWPRRGPQRGPWNGRGRGNPQSVRIRPAGSRRWSMSPAVPPAPASQGCLISAPLV